MSSSESLAGQHLETSAGPGASIVWATGRAGDLGSRRRSRLVPLAGAGLRGKDPNRRPPRKLVLPFRLPTTRPATVWKPGVAAAVLLGLSLVITRILGFGPCACNARCLKAAGPQFVASFAPAGPHLVLPRCGQLLAGAPPARARDPR